MRTKPCSVLLQFLVLATAMTPVLAAAPVRTVGKADPAVFSGPPAAAAPDIFDDRHKNAPTLRILTVDERVGATHRNELVRVPLFFHAGECTDPNALAIVPAAGPDKTPLPFQADDIRRDAAGNVARMHVYFPITLDPWARKQFHLVRAANPAANTKPLSVTMTADRVTFAGDDISITFYAQGDKAGAIADIQTAAGKVTVPGNLLAPEVTLARRVAADATQARESNVSYATPDKLDIRDVRWSSGPLFAKLITRIGPAGVPDAAEFIYMIPKQGSEFLQTEILRPEVVPSPDTVGTPRSNKTRPHPNILLAGGLVLGDSPADQSVVRVSAALRKNLQWVHNFYNFALVNPKAKLSLMAIPFSQPAGYGRTEDWAAGANRFDGPSTFQFDAGRTLSAYFCQMRYIFSSAVTTDELWENSRRSFGSLVAVVDEPWAEPGDFVRLTTNLAQEFRAIKNWGRGWEQDATIAALSGDTDDAAKLLRKNLRAIGGDPYSFTYIHSTNVPLSLFVGSNPEAEKVAYNGAVSSATFGGRLSEFGFPRMQSFGQALNMHMGTYLMSMFYGPQFKNPDLAQWARDAVHNQTILGNFGRGQRTYGVNYGQNGTSDLLYEGVSDFWLRATELSCNEDLSMHPAIFGRYLDAVDVNSDLYQRDPSAPADRSRSWERATMFRTQSHDHRWESWSCSPYLGMFYKASDRGMVGLTDACYFADHIQGRHINWSELNPIYFAQIYLRKGLDNYTPVALPPLPANTKVSQTGTQATVSWNAVPGAAGYRVYRAAAPGGPWTFVNSPYRDIAAFNAPDKGPNADFNRVSSSSTGAGFPALPDTLIKTTTYTDPVAPPNAIYFVTAVNASRRESRWFPDEPLPAPSRRK